MLKDEQWGRIAPLVPGKKGDPGRSGEDNRLFLEGFLWIARTGSPWRDLPAYFGKWFSVWKRFRRWALKGVFEKIFKVLSGDPDFEYAMMMARSSKFTGTGPAQKGDSESSHRPFARRADNEDRPFG